MQPRVPLVNRTEIDGIPTFWVDGPRPFTATLYFRVGQFDETIPQRGITHLIEHLALFPAQDTEINHNGEVGTHLTTFWAQGHPDEVGAYLRTVATSLHDLPMGRLDVEADILRREDAEEGRSSVNSLLWAYYGPFGPGTGSFPERGLSWLRPPDLEEWARRYFTRQNAALVVLGKPPETFGLELPDGEAMPYSTPDFARPPPENPTLYTHTNDGITWTAAFRHRLGEVEPEFYVALDVLVRRLRNRLRHDLGQVYWIHSGSMRLDADLRAAWLTFPCDPEASQLVTSDYLDVVGRFLEAGPTQEELDRFHRTMSKSYEDRPLEFAATNAHHEAESHLAGWGPFPTFEEWLGVAASLTGEDVRARFVEAYRQSFTIADTPAAQLAPFMYGMLTGDGPGPGVQFESKWRYRRDQARQIRIGPAGLFLQYPGFWQWVPYENIAMIAIEGNTIWIEALAGALELDTGRYVRSRSPWRTRLPKRDVAVGFFLVTIVLTLLSPALWLPLLGGAVAALSILFRESDPEEMSDRNSTMGDLMRQFSPEGVILPPPRSDASVDSLVG